MRFTITARHVELTEALEAYAEKKIKSHVERLVNAKGDLPDSLVAVEIAKETGHHRKGEIWKAAATITTPHEKRRIHAEARADDLYAAIDLLSEEIARELKTEKGRLRSLMLRGARAVKRVLRFNPLSRFRKANRVREEGE